jgi:hypothetical protein
LSVVVRRAGRFGGTDGSRTVWSVADGRRGRRWRWTTSGADSGPGLAFTLETAPDGTFLKLEAAAPGVLLTLHREPDGSIHGNRVGFDGVRHLRFPGAPPAVILAGSSPLAAAVAVAGRRVGGEGGECPVLVLDAALDPEHGTGSIEPAGDDGWAIWTAEWTLHVRLDADGLPILDGESWPLEEG